MRAILEINFSFSKEDCQNFDMHGLHVEPVIFSRYSTSDYFASQQAKTGHKHDFNTLVQFFDKSLMMLFDSNGKSPIQYLSKIELPFLF